MKRRMISGALMVAVLLLGVFAGPVMAQQVGDEVNGTTAETCALAVAAAYDAAGNDAVFDRFAPFIDDDGDIVEGEEQNLIDEVVAFLTEEGFLDDDDTDFGDICGIYLEVLGETMGFELAGPISFCEADIPFLELRLTLDVDEIDLHWVEVTDDLDGVDPGEVYEGEDEFGEAVTGIIRKVETVDIDPNESGFTPVLWPGMVLNDDGDPIGWPGFVPVLEDPDDINSDVLGWNEVSDGFGDWARALPEERRLGLFAEFNPTTDLFYTGYPPANAECAGPPDLDDDEPQVVAQPAAQVLGVTLARTGVDAAIIALIGIVLTGLGVVAVRRTRSEMS